MGSNNQFTCRVIETGEGIVPRKLYNMLKTSPGVSDLRDPAHIYGSTEPRKLHAKANRLTYTGQFVDSKWRGHGSPEYLRKLLGRYHTSIPLFFKKLNAQ